MKKLLFFAAVAATVLTTGCMSEESGVSVTSGDNAIAFRSLIDKATRASSVGSTAELTNFFVQGGAHASAAPLTDLDFMEAPVFKDGGAWTYAPVKYYPTNGDVVDFYAYTPIKDVNMTSDLAVVAGNAQFGYTVPADQKVNNTATDLLVASVEGKTDDGSAVQLTFDHALSAVTFSAANRNAADSELTYVISDISITKMYNVGTFDYPFSATSWTSVGTRTSTYIAGLPEAGVALEAIGAASARKLLSANDLMMILPQAVTAGTLDEDGVTPLVDETFVEVTYSLKAGDGTPLFTDAVRRLTLPAGFEFEAGKRYNFEFEFGGLGNNGLGEVEFSVDKLNDWDDVDEELTTVRPVEIDYSTSDAGSKSNSFILNSVSRGSVYNIPIDQVNRYWGGNLAGYGNDPANVIGADDEWSVELIWSDLPASALNSTAATSLYTASTTAITLTDNNGLGAGAGKGPDQTFELNVPGGLPAGNFLIGIKKQGGADYLWSWHFWVTDYNPNGFDPSTISSGTYTYPVEGGQVERYADNDSGSFVYEPDLWSTRYADNVMMDRALGAVETYFTTQPTNNMRGILYYQFGRKDPIPSQTGLTPKSYTTAYSVAISESVKSPWTFYSHDAGKWTNNTSINEADNIVWNDPAAPLGSGAKSIYDPCPPGWQLPSYDFYSDFYREVNSTLYNTLNPARDLGWSYGQGIGSASEPVNGLRYWPGTTGTEPVDGQIWFPATGQRYIDGTLTDVGSYGCYWSETPNSNPCHGYYLNFNENMVPKGWYFYGGHGCAARCISE
jgi:hypothetical protein